MQFSVLCNTFTEKVLLIWNLNVSRYSVFYLVALVQELFQLFYVEFHNQSLYECTKYKGKGKKEEA